MCVPSRLTSLITNMTATLVLVACGSPPKPPTVNEAARRPANSAVVVELQSCRSELANTRIEAAESARRADLAMAAADRIVALQQAIELVKPPKHESSPATCPPVAAEVVLPPTNSIYTVQFEFGSTHVSLPTEVMKRLLAQARSAPLVVLRGRTDGSQDLAAEIRIARDRALAVKAHLVGAGLDPSRIRTTWQPTGDHAADNGTPEGQARNRRVEIEVYAALPTAPRATTDSQP